MVLQGATLRQWPSQRHSIPLPVQSVKLQQGWSTRPQGRHWLMLELQTVSP
jgi:hypothetical protein